MFEEKQKECEFLAARVKLLEKDLEVVRQDRDSFQRMWVEARDSWEVAEAELFWERSDRWRNFTGGV
jgi:hypothetical protein